MVQFAYTAASPLRYRLGGTMNLLPILLDESRHSQLEQMWRAPVEAFVDYWAGMFPFLLDLTNEARKLRQGL